MLQQILPLVMLFKVKTMFTEAISLGKMVRRIWEMGIFLMPKLSRDYKSFHGHKTSRQES